MDWMIALYIWLGVVALVYLFACLDTMYYQYDVPRIYMRVLDAFTEAE